MISYVIARPLVQDVATTVLGISCLETERNPKQIELDPLPSLKVKARA